MSEFAKSNPKQITIKKPFWAGSFLVAHAEQLPPFAPFSIARLSLEVNFHRFPCARGDLVPLFAHIPLRTAMAAFSGFAPDAQDFAHRDGTPAPDELPGKSRFTARHAGGVKRVGHGLDGFGYESLGHGFFCVPREVDIENSASYHAIMLPDVVSLQAAD
jgi:hypothetical protein